MKQLGIAETADGFLEARISLETKTRPNIKQKGSQENKENIQVSGGKGKNMLRENQNRNQIISQADLHGPSVTSLNEFITLGEPLPNTGKQIPKICADDKKQYRNLQIVH